MGSGQEWTFPDCPRNAVPYHLGDRIVGFGTAARAVRGLVLQVCPLSVTLLHVTESPPDVPRYIEEYCEILWPDDRTGPWCIRANWVMIGSRPECVGLIIWHGAVQDPQDILKYRPLHPSGPQSISSVDFRALPLATVLDKLRAKAIKVRRQQRAHLAEYLSKGRLGGDLDELAPPSPLERSSRMGRKPKYDLRHFAEVAEVYLDAWEQGGQSPTQAVARHFGVPRSTAAKWVARARQDELLSEAGHGRAGATAGPRLRVIRGKQS